jgi:hypothetical protein
MNLSLIRAVKLLFFKNVASPKKCEGESPPDTTKPDNQLAVSREGREITICGNFSYIMCMFSCFSLQNVFHHF